MRQWEHYALYYKEEAGVKIAGNFVDLVENAINFISEKPEACAIYKTNGELAEYQYRKWRVKKFPYTVFFRIEEKKIYIDAIYAHKMDMDGRFLEDLHGG